MVERRAVVLLSGGLDSSTVVAIAKSEGFSVYALSFDYGQTHKAELQAAARVAATLEVARHIVLKIDLRAFGGSALTGDIAVPKHRSLDAMGTGVPITYVPARNTIFLSFALAWAEVLGRRTSSSASMPWTTAAIPTAVPIHRGVRADGESCYPGRDRGRREFKIHTPLIEMTKPRLSRQGWGSASTTA